MEIWPNVTWTRLLCKQGCFFERSFQFSDVCVHAAFRESFRKVVAPQPTTQATALFTADHVQNFKISRKLADTYRDSPQAAVVDFIIKWLFTSRRTQHVGGLWEPGKKLLKIT